MKRLSLYSLVMAVLAAGCTSPPPASVEEHLLPPTPAPVPAAETSRVLSATASLADYVKCAQANNPGLKASFHRWQAAMEKVDSEQSLENPSLTYEYYLRQLDTRQSLSLAQAFPWFGKRKLKAGIASAEAAAAEQDFEAARLKLVYQVKEAWYDYYFLSRSTATTEKTLRLVEDLEKSVQARYESGAAPFSDLVKVQLERDKIKNDLAGLRDEQGVRSIRLSSLLSLRTTAPLPWPAAFTQTASSVSEEQAFKTLEANSPELKALSARLSAEEQAVALAGKNGLPDFMLGVSGMQMAGKDGGSEVDASLMLGLSLPLWRGRYAAERREAQARKDAAAQERAGRKDELHADLKTALLAFRQADRRVKLFSESLVPKAAQALETARQDYSTGKADFMALLDAQRTSLEFELLRDRAGIDREIALAEIERLTGTKKEQ